MYTLKVEKFSYSYLLCIIFNLVEVKRSVRRKFSIIVSLIFLIIFLSLVNDIYAQESKKSLITGSVQSNFSLYELFSKDSTISPRQNKYSYVIDGNLSFNINERIRIPITFSIMNNQFNAYYPVPNLKFSKKLFHPSSVLSFAPNIKWASIYLGSHVPVVSKLIAGEIQIFGAGFDINPKYFRLSASHGISDIEVSPDSIKGIKGSFRRNYQTIKIGFGKKEKSGFYLNAVRFRDITGPIIKYNKTLIPKEGIGLGSDFVSSSNKCNRLRSFSKRSVA